MRGETFSSFWFWFFEKRRDGQDIDGFLVVGSWGGPICGGSRYPLWCVERMRVSNSLILIVS